MVSRLKRSIAQLERGEGVRVVRSSITGRFVRRSWWTRLFRFFYVEEER